MTAVHVDGGLRAVLSAAVLAGAAMPVGKSAHAIKFIKIAIFLVRVDGLSREKADVSRTGGNK